MLTLLVYLLVLCVVLGIVYWIVTMLPIAQPFKNVALALVGLIALVFILGVVFGGWQMPAMHHLR